MIAGLGLLIALASPAALQAAPAAINVITAERYKEVTDQSIQYALGYWGKEAPAVMDLSVKDRILDRPRAKEWRNWSAPDLSLKEVRQKFGGPGVSDEDLVLRVIAGEAFGKRHAATPDAYEEQVGGPHVLLYDLRGKARKRHRASG